uniref:Ig-like domain-containing protein n=1 Tax=Hucho hucho TaxID=62062 RepID=A0A4W5LPY9_9TELE
IFYFLPAEPDILVTQPTVKVLPPSTKECEDRNKKKKKTLVCVATDFYPDHVTVFWQLNGGAQITDGVGTDNTALRDENRSYSITSRLRVPAKKWNKSSNRFTCTVRFFNGTHNIDVADHINGEGGDDGEMTTGKRAHSILNYLLFNIIRFTILSYLIVPNLRNNIT